MPNPICFYWFHFLKLSKIILKHDLISFSKLPIIISFKFPPSSKLIIRYSTWNHQNPIQPINSPSTFLEWKFPGNLDSNTKSLVTIKSSNRADTSVPKQIRGDSQAVAKARIFPAWREVFQRTVSRAVLRPRTLERLHTRNAWGSVSLRYYRRMRATTWRNVCMCGRRGGEMWSHRHVTSPPCSTSYPRIILDRQFPGKGPWSVARSFQSRLTSRWR